MKPVIAGNWKMHHGPHDTAGFFAALDRELESLDAELLVFPPALSFHSAVQTRPSFVGLGVQNLHYEPKGAFTGEVSASMAAEAGASHALVGHSERRHVFGETDDDVARKVVAAVDAGLVPVVCVGETIDERRAGRVEEVIGRQIDAALAALRRMGAEEQPRFLVAYEPVWAIGTGETATPEDAGAAHRALRGRLRDGLGDGPGGGVPILYGGSVKPDNAASLLTADEVGGVLVGGASLDPDSFARIARASG